MAESLNLNTTNELVFLRSTADEFGIISYLAVVYNQDSKCMYYSREATLGMKRNYIVEMFKLKIN